MDPNVIDTCEIGVCQKPCPIHIHAHVTFTIYTCIIITVLLNNDVDVLIFVTAWKVYIIIDQSNLPGITMGWLFPHVLQWLAWLIYSRYTILVHIKVIYVRCDGSEHPVSKYDIGVSAPPTTTFSNIWNYFQDQKSATILAKLKA